MMRLTEDEYEVIRPLLPVQRGNVRIGNLDVLNAVLYVAENGCKWRALPARFGNGHTIYTLASPVGGGGRAGPRVPSAPGASPDPHPRGVCRLGQRPREGPPRWDGCAPKNRPQAIGKSRGGWTTKIHLVAANERMALTFALSPGQAHDAPEGRKLLTRWQRRPDGVPMVMDRAYEGDQTRQLVLQLGFAPVVAPNPNRRHPGPTTAASTAGATRWGACSAGSRAFVASSPASRSSTSCSPPSSISP